MSETVFDNNENTHAHNNSPSLHIRILLDHRRFRNEKIYEEI